MLLAEPIVSQLMCVCVVRIGLDEENWSKKRQKYGL